MLAQIELEWWHVLLAAMTLVLVKGFEWFKEWLKDRRERESDNNQTEFLKRISNSNESMSSNIATLNERLLGERELHRQMHSENLSKMDTICKVTKIT